MLNCDGARLFVKFAGWPMDDLQRGFDPVPTLS